LSYGGTMKIILSLLLFLLAVPAFSQSEKVDPLVWQLLHSKSEQEVPILVFLDEADLSETDLIADKKLKHQRMYEILTWHARRTQFEVRQQLDKANLEYTSYYITNMIAVYDSNIHIVRDLLRNEKVRRISANPEIESLPPFQKSVGSFGVESSLEYIGVKKVWDKYNKRGEGIVVAGQDTGIEWNHPALIKQYRGYSKDGVDHNYNWHDAIHKNASSNRCGAKAQAPCDDNGHGTHTLGTVVGDDHGINQIGVAPRAKWIGCRNMDNGFGTPARYIECFEFFFAPYAYGADKFKDAKVELAADVINNSWGCPASEGCAGDEFIPVLKRLKDVGIMVVVSAGNEGPACSSIANAPAHNTEHVLSVGAYDHRYDRIAGFSSRGPSAFNGRIGPNVVAPGVNIRSAVPGKQYAQWGWSGTSMAGPHVAGQVALMWSIQPELQGDVSRTAGLIMSSATEKKATRSCGEALSAIPNNTYGFGVVDVFQAVEKSLEN